jgi:hypothetical protein
MKNTDNTGTTKYERRTSNLFFETFESVHRLSDNGIPGGAPMKKALVFFLLLLPLAALAAQEARDPLRYEIWVSLDPAYKMLSGRETIRWTNTSRDTVPDIWFHLYWNAFKNERSALMEEALQGGAEGTDHGDADVKDGDWGWIDVERIRLADGGDLTRAMEFMIPDEPRHDGDQTVMRVKLPRPLAPGEAIDLELAFKARIPKTIRRSGYYHDGYFIGQWYPKPGVYQEGRGWNCHQYHLNSEFSPTSPISACTSPCQAITWWAPREKRRPAKATRSRKPPPTPSSRTASTISPGPPTPITSGSSATSSPSAK